MSIALNGKEDGLKPLRADVTPELRRRVKVRAAQEELTMREYIISALERDLEANESGAGTEEERER